MTLHRRHKTIDYHPLKSARIKGNAIQKENARLVEKLNEINSRKPSSKLPFIPRNNKKLLGNSMGFNARRNPNFGSGALVKPIRHIVDTRRDGFQAAISLTKPILVQSKENLLLGQTSSRRLFYDNDKPRLMEEVDRERREIFLRMKHMKKI